MSTTDVREWAKAKGLEIGAKGRIPATVQEQYDAEHSDGTATVTMLSGDPLGVLPYTGDDYDGGVSAADFPEPADEPEPEPERPARAREVAPRRIRQPRPAPQFPIWRRRKNKTAKPAKRLPRISLARLIEDAWSQLAFAAGPIPPMQRLMQAQAPMAGIILEDALRDTAADRFLQPVARAEEKAKGVAGLVMPPVALLSVLMTAPQPVERDGQLVFPEPSVQHKGALISLRWSLMLMAEAGSGLLGEYKERAEANAERGRQADEFMAWILGIEEQPAEVGEAISAEDEAIRRAQAMFGGDA